MNEYKNLTLEQINNSLKTLSTAGLSCILPTTDVEKIHKQLMNAKQQKIMETYPIRIWQASNGTWRAHVPDDTKERHRRTIQGKTKENLENNILKDYEQKFENPLIFSKFFANWLLKYKASKVKGPTIQRYYSDYQKFIKGTTIDNTKITDIKRKHIKEFLNDIINENHLTRKSLNNVKSIFNGVFAYALDEDFITVNPMLNLKIENTNIKPETEKDSETEIFDEDEFDSFVEYLYKHYLDYKPLLTLAILLNFQLGLRVGELCTLKKEDINLNTSKIHIRRMERSYRPLRIENNEIVQDTTIHEVVGETKKNSNRIIDLSDEAVAIINRILLLHDEQNISSDFLFPDENGNHSIRQRYNECLEYYCKHLDLDCKSSHKVRKTVLSNLFANGFDIEEVMKIAGHRNKVTTFKYYLFSVNRKKDRRKRMNDALSSNHCTFIQPTVNPNLTA